jgi:hypothetical protein
MPQKLWGGPFNPISPHGFVETLTFLKGNAILG